MEVALPHDIEAEIGSLSNEKVYTYRVLFSFAKDPDKISVKQISDVPDAIRQLLQSILTNADIGKAILEYVCEYDFSRIGFTQVLKNIEEVKVNEKV